ACLTARARPLLFARERTCRRRAHSSAPDPERTFAGPIMVDFACAKVSAGSPPTPQREAAMAGVTFNYIDVLGYLGGALTLATFAMPRMIPLRIIGIAANCAFISYGLATPLYPVLALHAVLLPLNVYRLREMLHLIAKVRTASRGDLSMDWLKPFMAR